MKKIMLFASAILLNSCLYGSSLEVGLGSVKFDYNEYDKDGSWLDSETNSAYELNGGFITYDYSLGELKDDEFIYEQSLELSYSFHYNTTDYNGHLLSNGAPIQTLTDNYLHQGHIRYKAVNIQEQNNIGIFVGLGYRYWDRELIGYLETYEWPYYEAGLSWKWFDKGFSLGLEASYQKAFNPKMTAYMKNVVINNLPVGKDFNFDLGDTDGYKIHIPLKYIVNNQWSVGLHYIYDQWTIERSNIVYGVSGRAWVEPKSTTKNQYTYISLEYKF